MVAVAPLRYLAEDGAVASRDLLGHEAQPGGEVAAFVRDPNLAAKYGYPADLVGHAGQIVLASPVDIMGNLDAEQVNSLLDTPMTRGQRWSLMVGIIGLIIGIYFLPTIVAAAARNHNARAIFILNLFLGWTFLGWVIALVWAFMKLPDRAEKI